MVGQRTAGQSALGEAAEFGNASIDIRQMILDALPLGHPYTAKGTVTEFQLSIPQLGVGFMDQEAILVRSDELINSLVVTGTKQGHYTAQVPLPGFSPLNLPPSSITRGWGYIDAQMNGTAFRFLTTHLEDGTNTLSPIFALVQALQAIQLMNGPAATAKPVIMAGDFNTVANNPSSPTFLTYLFILGNGFTDGWLRAHPFLPGLTCCQEDLTSSTSALTQRLDLVFARNHISVLGAQLVGNHLDTIPNVGIWQSTWAWTGVSFRIWRTGRRRFA
jgi:hypothetical protein